MKLALVSYLFSVVVARRQSFQSMLNPSGALSRQHVARILQPESNLCSALLQLSPDPESCICEREGDEILVTCSDLCSHCSDNTCASYVYSETRYEDIGEGSYFPAHRMSRYQHETAGIITSTEFSESATDCLVHVNGQLCNSCTFTFACDDYSLEYLVDCTNIPGVLKDFDECDVTSNVMLGADSPFYARTKLSRDFCASVPSISTPTTTENGDKESTVVDLSPPVPNGDNTHEETTSSFPENEPVANIPTLPDIESENIDKPSLTSDTDSAKSDVQPLTPTDASSMKRETSLAVTASTSVATILIASWNIVAYLAF